MKANANTAMNALIVEDEVSICEICRIILSNEGFSVDVAHDGITARDMIEERQYDLCLLDIFVPRMNGLELYQWLEEKHPLLKQRVLFTTGDVTSNSIKLFLEKSNSPYLYKPFTPDELRDKTRELLRRLEEAECFSY